MRAALLLVLALACDDPPPPARAPDRDPVLATVGGEAILRSEVERGVAREIYQRQIDIHSLLTAELDRIIEARLLEREAARRGTSVPAMLAEVEAKTATVAEAEIDAYLASHGASSESDGSDRRDRVRAYLEGRARIEQRLAFVAELRQRADVAIRLEPPVAPRVEVEIGDAPTRGAAGEDARVTIVHFGSFTDPRSRALVPVIASLARQHPNQIRWVHHHALRPGDELGLDAAILALQAQGKDRFWPVHDALFALPAPPMKADLQKIGAENGFDESAIEAARADASNLTALKREHEIARRSGVQTPPVFVVNGRWFQGTFGADALRSLIEEELGDSSVR